MTNSVGPFAKSSYSTQEDNCVEVAPTSIGGRAVRDSKDQAGPILAFARGGWEAFLAGAKSEEIGRAARG